MGLLVMVKPTQMTHSRRVEWAGSLIPSGMRKLNKRVPCLLCPDAGPGSADVGASPLGHLMHVQCGERC